MMSREKLFCIKDLTKRQLLFQPIAATIESKEAVG